MIKGLTSVFVSELEAQILGNTQFRKLKAERVQEQQADSIKCDSLDNKRMLFHYFCVCITAAESHLTC